MRHLQIAPLALALALAFSSPVHADSASQSLPFAQDWSNSGLIAIDDDWSGVPGIIGYRGDGLTGSTGTNPQGILADGTGVADVNANQTAPNTFNTGGVAEFALADPTIALDGIGHGRCAFHSAASRHHRLAVDPGRLFAARSGWLSG